MHRLLKRQVKKFVSRNGEVPDELKKFVEAIDEAYGDFDTDRRMLERSLELSSQELGDANQGLRRQTLELEEKIDQINEMQRQLVMQEKMASLGGLTAGIAHEIKNPLNFINNFSELSAELVEELREYFAPGEELDMEEVNETLELLEGNVKKITDHGRRADSIVKGMLLHSRGQSGERQSTNINELLDEYVNLAYHGMRAQDTSFNIGIERSYDDDVGELSVVPQELSRVFLNIVSNACYATKMRADSEGADFQPVVTVSTKSFGDHIEVRIHDNGTGIPDDVKEQIFNPFFTTKPPGSGTGLGLSITYDIIVQQHKGTIDVQTEPGKFTEFILTVPREAAVAAQGLQS